MEVKHKRARHRASSLTIQKRKNGSDVYVVRWREPIGHGETRQRKQVLGTVKELTKTQAQKLAEKYRQLANAPKPVEAGASLSVARLVEHYKQRELGEDSGKATKPRKAYLYIFANYILPKWGTLPLAAVKTIAVEDWLKTLPLANGSKAKVREVFGAAFRHAIRYELYPTNPIAAVRQVRKRAVEPEILEPAEILAILKELDGVEPVRTAFLIAAVGNASKRNLRPEVGRRGLRPCDSARSAFIRGWSCGATENGVLTPSIADTAARLGSTQDVAGEVVLHEAG
jgi:integrase